MKLRLASSPGEGVFCETKRGVRAEICSYGKRCRRKKSETEFHGAICAVSTPLKPLAHAGDRFFEITVDEVSVFDWSGGLDVGLTSIHPKGFPETLPTLIDDLPRPLWWIDGTEILRVYSCVGEYREVLSDGSGFDTGNLKVGDTVRISITPNGGIRIQINDQKCAYFDDAQVTTDREIFGLVSVYGKTTCVSLAGGSFDDGVSSSISVRREVVELWERVFESTSKDISLQCSDGIEEANSCVLIEASDVWRAMLTHNMKEKQLSTVNMSDYTVKEVRFFLRLLYTGQVDPDEWSDDETTSNALASPDRNGLPALQCTGSNVSASGLASNARPVTGAACASNAVVGNGTGSPISSVALASSSPASAGCSTVDMSTVACSVSVANHNTAVASNAPANHTDQPSNHSNFSGDFRKSRLKNPSPCSQAERLSPRTLLQAPSKIARTNRDTATNHDRAMTAERTASSSAMASNNFLARHALANGHSPAGSREDDVSPNFPEAKSLKARIKSDNGEDQYCAGSPPLSLILACMSLCRKYQVIYEEWILEKIKKGCNAHSFGQISEFAIREDITALRLWLMRFAIETPSIRELYESGSLPPTVCYELKNAFPSVRTSRKRKALP